MKKVETATGLAAKALKMKKFIELIFSKKKEVEEIKKEIKSSEGDKTISGFRCFQKIRCDNPTPEQKEKLIEGMFGADDYVARSQTLKRCELTSDQRNKIIERIIVIGNGVECALAIRDHNPTPDQEKRLFDRIVKNGSFGECRDLLSDSSTIPNQKRRLRGRMLKCGNDLELRIMNR